MAAKQRRIVIITMMVFGLILMGVGLFFLDLGLEDADKAASVVGAIAGIAGLGLSTVSFLLARPGASSAAQRVDNVEAGSTIDLVDGVAGNARLGDHPPVVTSQPSERPATPSHPQGEQSVTNTKATGAIRIVRGVDGDLDINP
ncbi:hypothetical protein FHR83_008423 [Actinoplanes campanulatus]|uniref:Uncharacterized protein n=1 Tax=Actinoplanes campanulatus TaxID=113559 RepID=A0A7W5AQQ2_9ACTN|nr:hypothetical protein [Actinoplanes campanulatus]MBB3100698.1 hypothetical protein [Actinoplanes campanulatus]GGN45422.1 hypothetical protein GCM10010109_79630 [Actinoplanes campanulatus]GID41158.1 hypothetical protein Aca09nite_76640 [Actinoplanes campanulatus]